MVCARKGHWTLWFHRPPLCHTSQTHTSDIGFARIFDKALTEFIVRNASHNEFGFT